MRLKFTDLKKWPKIVGASLLIVLCVVFSAFEAQGQGWVRKFGGGALDQAEDILTTVDGGHVLLGFKEGFQNRVYLVRTDVDGDVLWEKDYGLGNTRGYDLLEDVNGDLIIAGEARLTAQQDKNLYFLRVSARGDSLSEIVLEQEGNQIAQRVIQGENGGFVVVGSTDDTDSGEEDVLLLSLNDKFEVNWSVTAGDTLDDRGLGVTAVETGYVVVGHSENPDGIDTDIFIKHFDRSGGIIWEEIIRTNEAEEAIDIVTADDGNVVFTGFQGNQGDILIAKYNLEGQEIWTSTQDNASLIDQATTIVKLNNGKFLLSGVTEVSASNLDIFVAQVSSEGQFEWLKTLGPVESIDFGTGIDLTIDGGYIVAASTAPLLQLDDILLVKTDGDLNTLSNRIVGTIETDFDSDNCSTFETLDFQHKQWVVEAIQGNTKFYGTTDVNGVFEIDVDTGAYLLNVIPPSKLWQFCDTEVVNFSSSYEAPQDVLLHVNQLSDFSAELKSDLRINIATPFVREGTEVLYDVLVINEGTDDAENVRVEIDLDEELRFVSAGSAPNFEESDTTNGKLVFFLSNIEVGASRKFFVRTEVADASNRFLPRQAVTVEGRVNSESNQNLDVQLPDLQALINKGTQTVKVFNKGGAFSGPFTGIVISDDIMFFRSSFPSLGIEDSIEFQISTPLPDTGNTIRVLATINGQGLNGFGSDAVEANGTNSEGSYTTGFFAQFPEDDLERTKVINVQENIGAQSAFEMRGYPKGYRDSIIVRNTDLTYSIYFQNQGSDTIDRVVIRDTLSELLDPSTLIAGASNLDYEFEIYNDRIVKFTFDNISLLPESSGVVDSTYGYVSFKVGQQVDLPFGSVIENNAGIFFDYQEPKLTNTITKVVGEFPEYIENLSVTSNDETYIEGVIINVFPNPFNNVTTIELEGREFNELTFSLFDVTGKLIERQVSLGNKIMYYRNQSTPSGTYFYRLESEGQLINTGKLMVR